MSSGYFSAMNNYTQEVVRALFSGLPMAIAGNAVLAVILVAVQAAEVTSQNTTLWLLAMVVVLVWRTALLIAYRRYYGADRAVSWLWHFRISTIANGLIWALASVLLYPTGDMATQVFLAFVLAGVSAGALISLQMDRVAALGFALPALLALALAFALQADNVSRAMGLMIIVYVVFYLAASRRAASQLQENHHLRALSLADQEKLRRSELHNRSILRTLPDMVLVVNKDGRFTECFDHPDLLVPRETVLQSSVTDILPPQVADSAMVAIRAALQSGEMACLEYSLEIQGRQASFEARTNRISADEALIVVRNASLQKQTEKSLVDQQQLAALIARAQSSFIDESDRRHTFDTLLADVLALTRSEYGFIAEVRHTAEGSPYLKTYAMTDIAWNDETRNFYEHNAPQGMEFSNLDNLFGAALTHGKPVIANDPTHDPRRGGLPEGHPALNAFLGLPARHGGEIVAVLGLANRPGGYNQALVDFLEPLLVALGQLVQVARRQLQARADQQELMRLSQVASNTTNGVIITDVDGRVNWINEGFTRITGYSLPEIYGHKPGELLQGADTNPQTVAQMRAALAQGEGFETDLVNYTKDGKPYWIRIQCNALRNEKGVLQGFIAIESDISIQKSTESELRDSTRLLEGIFENVPNMIFLKDAEDLRFKYFNRAGELLLGHSRDQLIGRNDYDFFPEEQADFFTSKDRDVLAQTQVVDIPEEVINTTRGPRTLHTRKLALFDETGSPQYLLGISEDITDEKRVEVALRDKEARLRGLFELSPIGIALNDYQTGAFLEINEALVRPTGYTREEFTAQSYWDVTPKDYEKHEILQLASLENTGRYGPYEKEYIRKDGSRYPVLLNGMVVYDNSGRKLIWSIVEDISERKRIDRMKSEFISTVSHELRTPLTAISGALGLLVGGAAGAIPAQLSEMLEIAYKNSQRLGYLINDLLDMEKLLAGKMHFEMRVRPLYPLLEQAILDNQGYADSFGVRLILDAADEGVQVNVDALRLHQILANLLSNAVKFSPEGAKVRISVATDNHRVRVAIADQGSGIPDSFRERIFQKFSQADSSDTRSKSGTGLGLAITRELVERMYGSIGFDSMPGAGTTFYFELPLVTGESRSIAC